MNSWLPFKTAIETPDAQYSQTGSQDALCALIASGLTTVPTSVCVSIWKRGAGLAAAAREWTVWASYMRCDGAQWHVSLPRPPMAAGEGQLSVSTVLLETLVSVFRQPAGSGVNALREMLASIGGSAAKGPPLLDVDECAEFKTEVERLCRLVFIAAVPDEEVSDVVEDKDVMLDVQGAHPSPFLKALMFLPTGIAVVHAVATEGVRIAASAALAAQLAEVRDALAGMSPPPAFENAADAAGALPVMLPGAVEAAMTPAMAKYDGLMKAVTDRFLVQYATGLGEVTRAEDEEETRQE